MTWNARRATGVLGVNRTRHGCQNIARALSLFPWNNTAQDRERLEATRWALRHWHAYQTECGRRRDGLFINYPFASNMWS